MSLIFLSHSSKDNAVAGEVAQWLREQGFDSLFLDYDPQDGIPAGRNWEQELYQQLRSCRAVIVLCSHHYVASQWCFVEVAQARALGKILFPLLIEPVDPPLLLADRQVIDFTSQRQEGFERLMRGLLVAGLDPKDLFQWDGQRPPYPGLLAYEERDAALFFGRDGAIGECLDQLHRLRRYGGKSLLLVLGASGCGKSSLVRAGVVPRLRRNPREWLVIPRFRPGRDPFGALALVLAEAFAATGDPIDPESLRSSLDSGARSSLSPGGHGSLLDSLERLRARHGEREATAVLVVDQMEELLGDNDAREASTRFLEMLRRSMEAASSGLLVIGTLRSDFLAVFQSHPAVQGLAFEEMLVAPMAVQDYIRIIEGPAALVGLTLETGLSQRMVNDACTGDALPLLAFTLRELWEKGEASHHRWTFDAYLTQLGGLNGSIQRAADGVYGASPLSDAQKQDLRQAFLSLARVNEDGQYARRAARWVDMPLSCRDVLQRFVDARLLVSGKEGGTLEVAHESLLRAWPLLKSWLDDGRAFLLWLQRFQVAIAEHASNGTLLSEGRLSEALRWRSSTAPESPERRLIDLSLKAQRRLRRRLRALQTLALVLLGGFTATLWRQLQATRAAQAEIFLERHRAQVENDPLESLVYGLAALRTYLSQDGWSHEVAEGLERAMQHNSVISFPIPSGQGPMRSLALLHDGELVSAGSNGTLRRWRQGVPMADPVDPIPSRQGEVVSLLALRDGGVVSGGRDGTLRWWLRGSPMGPPVPTGQGSVVSLLELANGDVISGGEDGSLRRWRQGRSLGENRTGSGQPIVSLIQLDRGEWLSADATGTLLRWRGDKTVGQAIRPGNGGAVTLQALTGGAWVSAGADGKLRWWRQGRPDGVPMDTGQGRVWSLAVLPDGTVVSGGADGTVRRWSRNGPIGPPLDTDQQAVLSLASLGNGDVISGGANGTIRFWRLQRFGRGCSRIRPPDPGTALVVLADQDFITGGKDGSLQRWRQCQPVGPPITTGQGAIVALALLPDGAVVSGSDDGTIRFWREGWPLGGTIATDQGAVVSLAVLKNGEVVSGGLNGSLRRWRDGQPINGPIATGQGAIYTLLALRNGDLISAGDRQDTLRFWRNGRPLEPPLATDQESVLSMVESAAGDLITGGADGSMRRWRLRGQEVKPFGASIPTAQGAVQSLLPLANGDVISGGSDGSLRRWRDGRPLGLPFPSGQSDVLQLSMIGKDHLLSLGGDGSLRIFWALGMARLACQDIRLVILNPRRPSEREAASLCRDLGVLREQGR